MGRKKDPVTCERLRLRLLLLASPDIDRLVLLSCVPGRAVVLLLLHRSEG